MVRQAEPRHRGEFELIAEIFAPLARALPGAFDLKDDVAALTAWPGHDLVLKTDSTIESVHFFSGDPPATIARKALRRALSDIGAKGAAPAAYLLAIALPSTISEAWIRKFAEGLCADQAQFRVALAGGETSRTPGTLTITVTAIGWVPAGRVLRRSGAKVGDDVWVTGTIGDAAGGLCLLKNEATLLDIAARERLITRFRVPEPRMEFGLALAGVANAAIDVSDGLVADLGHVAALSGARIEVELERVPVSADLCALWGSGPQMRLRAVGAGDDYEIAFTAPPKASDEVVALALRTRVPATRIGRLVAGPAGVSIRDLSGREVCPERTGYTHF